MFALKRFIGGSLFVFVLAGTALAQENRAPVEKPGEPVATGPLVTAAATAKRVRFVSPGTVVQLRLEVYNEAGQKLFDTELRGGNVLDWHLQDGAGERLQAGSYACVLTSKSLSGRLSQRVGLVTVNDKKVAVETAGGTQLSLAQQQTIGPVESNAAFTVVQESEAEAITTVTHDGNDGQMARTRGALSFRVGDFFSGKDKEQMRLTAEGNLGIGTSNPEVKLDVAGMIRAREGFMFSDGSTLKVNEKGVLTRTSADGSDPKSITATTQNKIAKFTDNLGTVGDSVITESVSGNIGIGTATPQSLLQVGPNAGYGATTGLLITNNLIGSQYDRAFQLAPRQTANPATNSILMYTLPTVNAGVTVPSQFGVFVDGRQGPGAITSYAAIATGQVQSLGASNNTHLLMGNLAIPAGNYAIYDNTGYKSFFKGNVGIGTSSPVHKLDVAGNINTSTHYFIGNNRVFGVAGFFNTFAGVNTGLANTGSGNSFFGRNAGATNTTGANNSFFGAVAGFANTTGSDNSFFGSNAGNANTTASFNSFFGRNAGAANTTGFSNSFFGSSAGAANTTGSSNSFFGLRAGESNTTGNSNSFFGENTGQSNTTGVFNSFFGYRTGFANTMGCCNSFFGNQAGLNTTSNSNSFFGNSAGVFNTTGGSNSFFGANAGVFNTTGGFNSFFGDAAGSKNTTGFSNSFIGRDAGQSNTEGNSNSFVGRDAGFANTTASFNSFFGKNAGQSNTTGGSNSFFGTNAGAFNTTGAGNIIIGESAGFVLVSGNNNIYLAADAAAANESNTIRIGTLTQTSSFIAGISGATSASGVTVLVNSSGQLGTLTSSRRYKQDIRDMGSTSVRLMQLRPVSFLYRPEYVDGDRTLQYGLIAEEVAKVYPELVVYAADGKPQTVRYHLLNTMLLNEVQKQQKRIQSQAQEISSLETRLRRLETGASRRQRARRR